MDTSSMNLSIHQKKDERERNAIDIGHYVLPATPMGSACTLLGPMVVFADSLQIVDY
jgi:hypothetical protein